MWPHPLTRLRTICQTSGCHGALFRNSTLQVSLLMNPWQCERMSVQDPNAHGCCTSSTKPASCIHGMSQYEYKPSKQIEKQYATGIYISLYFSGGCYIQWIVSKRLQCILTYLHLCGPHRFAYLDLEVVLRPSNSEMCEGMENLDLWVWKTESTNIIKYHYQISNMVLVDP